MKKTTIDFLNLLFKEGESICVSDGKYGYHSVEQSELEGNILLKSPSDKVRNRNITEYDINLVALNPIKGFRQDKNVTGFRTFLVELDDGSLKSQREYIAEMGMPYSLCVFSGNKSLHYGIVLEEDLVSDSYWRIVNKWILNIMSKADQQTLNPSRSIRFPDNIRKNDKMKKQALIEIGPKISQVQLNIWLNKFPEHKPKPKQDIYADRENVPVVSEGDMPDWLYHKLQDGVMYERNATWFKYACAMAKIGFDIVQIIELFEKFYIEENDFKREEWISCIESACKVVMNE